MRLIQGDCREVLKGMSDASVDSVVTDPPYELGFMGKAWDASGIAYSVDLWRDVLRVLKPGGHLLAFGGTRTYHRMACAIEDAGFEVRDSLHWIYGTGFPKSLDVSKAIDKAAGAEREVIGLKQYGDGATYQGGAASGRSGGGIMGEPAERGPSLETAPATDAARQWAGWGTALKPAHEPIVMTRKPLVGTVAANVQAFGTGAINVDGCRLSTGLGGTRSGEASAERKYSNRGSTDFAPTPGPRGGDARGRWPANVLFAHLPDCTDDECAPGCAVAELDRQSGTLKSGTGAVKRASAAGWRGNALGTESRPAGTEMLCYGDSGGASRFFYVAKPSRAERDLGCDDLPALSGGAATDREDGSAGTQSPLAGAGRNGGARNIHPTVKPVALMRYLCRLVTPPGGIVLDPFTGSGTTGMAAAAEGLHFIGIERDASYLEIARHRLGLASEIDDLLVG